MKKIKGKIYNSLPCSQPLFLKRNRRDVRRSSRTDQSEASTFRTIFGNFWNKEDLWLVNFWNTFQISTSNSSLQLAQHANSWSVPNFYHLFVKFFVCSSPCLVSAFYARAHDWTGLTVMRSPSKWRTKSRALLLISTTGERAIFSVKWFASDFSIPHISCSKRKARRRFNWKVGSVNRNFKEWGPRVTTYIFDVGDIEQGRAWVKFIRRVNRINLLCTCTNSVWFIYNQGTSIVAWAGPH